MRWLFLAFVLLALSGCTGDSESSSIEEVHVSASEVRTATVALDVEAVVGAGITGEGWSLRVQVEDSRTGLLLASESVLLSKVDDARAGSFTIPVEVPRTANVRLEVQVLEDGIVEQQWQVRVQNLDLLAPDVQDTGVRVDHADLNVRAVTDGRVDLGATLYLTNEGATASSPLRAQVVARETTTRLVTDEEWIDVASVPSGGTMLARLGLDLPDEQAYSIETTLWQDAFVVGRTAESLEFGKNGTAVARSVDLVYDAEEDRVYLGDGDSDAEDDASAPGLPLVGLGAALLVAAVVVRKRRG